MALTQQYYTIASDSVVEVGSTLVDRLNKAMKFFLIQATFNGTI